MKNIIEEIDHHFSAEILPLKDELVKFDGYDPLDKNAALEAFGGKSSDQILEYIRTEKYAWRTNHLEKLTICEPQAIRYYLRAYLKSMIHEIAEAQPDVDFIDRVFFETWQAIKMKGRDLFNNDQRNLLLNLGEHVLEAIQNDKQGRFEIGGEHIAENIRNVSGAFGFRDRE